MCIKAQNVEAVFLPVHMFFQKAYLVKCFDAAVVAKGFYDNRCRLLCQFSALQFKATMLECGRHKITAGDIAFARFLRNAVEVPISTVPITENTVGQSVADISPRHILKNGMFFRRIPPVPLIVELLQDNIALDTLIGNMVFAGFERKESRIFPDKETDS